MPGFVPNIATIAAATSETDATTTFLIHPDSPTAQLLHLTLQDSRTRCTLPDVRLEDTCMLQVLEYLNTTIGTTATLGEAKCAAVDHFYADAETWRMHAAIVCMMTANAWASIHRLLAD